MLNYQQQLHSLPVGNHGNFYYAATTMPSAGHNSSGPASASGTASLPHHPEAAYNVQPQSMEQGQKVHHHEATAYAKDKHVSASSHRRELDKMHRFSVDNLIELKQDVYAKGKISLELSNSFGKLLWPAFNCNNRDESADFKSFLRRCIDFCICSPASASKYLNPKTIWVNWCVKAVSQCNSQI